MDTIIDSLSKNENVIVDTSNMSVNHISELTNEINIRGLADNILFWPWFEVMKNGFKRKFN